MLCIYNEKLYICPKNCISTETNYDILNWNSQTRTLVVSGRWYAFITWYQVLLSTKYLVLKDEDEVWNNKYLLSGGSRISRRGGAPTPEFGAKT